MVIVIEFGPLSNLLEAHFDPRPLDIVQLQLEKMMEASIVAIILYFQIFSGLLLIISGFVFSKISRFVLPSKKKKKVVVG